jgi:transmembrane sensor
VTDVQREDIVWKTAVEWVIREHGPLSPADLKELIAWLNQDSSHRTAYEEASRLWLLTGFLPSSTPPSDK